MTMENNDENAEMDQKWLLMSWDERRMFVLIGEASGKRTTDEIKVAWADPETTARTQARVERIHAAVEQRMGVAS